MPSILFGGRPVPIAIFRPLHPGAHIPAFDEPSPLDLVSVCRTAEIFVYIQLEHLDFTTAIRKGPEQFGEPFLIFRMVFLAHGRWSHSVTKAVLRPLVYEPVDRAVGFPLK